MHREQRKVKSLYHTPTNTISRGNSTEIVIADLFKGIEFQEMLCWPSNCLNYGVKNGLIQIN